MLKILLRAQLGAYWARFSGATRSKKRQGAGKAVLFSLLMLYVLGCFGFMPSTAMISCSSLYFCSTPCTARAVS